MVGGKEGPLPALLPTGIVCPLALLELVDVDDPLPALIPDGPIAPLPLVTPAGFGDVFPLFDVTLIVPALVVRADPILLLLDVELGLFTLLDIAKVGVVTFVPVVKDCPVKLIPFVVMTPRALMPDPFTFVVLISV